MIEYGASCTIIHPQFIEAMIRTFNSDSLTDILANVHTTSRKELVITELAPKGERGVQYFYLFDLVDCSKAWL